MWFFWFDRFYQATLFFLVVVLVLQRLYLLQVGFAGGFMCAAHQVLGLQFADLLPQSLGVRFRGEDRPVGMTTDEQDLVLFRPAVHGAFEVTGDLRFCGRTCNTEPGPPHPGLNPPVQADEESTQPGEFV